MNKIRKVKFINHPVLGDLYLNFCNSNEEAIDTIILAGENGVGKSTILEVLYGCLTRNPNIHVDVDLEIEIEGQIHNLQYRYNNNMQRVIGDGGREDYIGNSTFKTKYPTSAIFSDVDINFRAEKVTTVTSRTLDSASDSYRSNSNFPTDIAHLIVDIQAADDSSLAQAVRQNPNLPAIKLKYEERMLRFTKAFDKMFDGLKYSRIETKDGHKEIMFSRDDKEFPLDNLSSGEKQIVYRGCFLLQNINALNGAFVFIDEPEISMHPNWQTKILDYYKGIFTSLSGTQTSQIFVVTHSPFVIHNPNRMNDKVIVLTKDVNSKIVTMDKPEYYNCESTSIVKDAFSINLPESGGKIVYVEGQTDEKYYNKMLEVYGIRHEFIVQSVGAKTESQGEHHSGDKSLNKAFTFFKEHDTGLKTAFIFDCDTRKERYCSPMVMAKSLSQYASSKKMDRGIENALILDDIEITDCYNKFTKDIGYGGSSFITELDKNKLCDYICAMDNEILKKVFTNLYTEFEEVLQFFEK